MLRPMGLGWRAIPLASSLVVGCAIVAPTGHAAVTRAVVAQRAPAPGHALPPLRVREDYPAPVLPFDRDEAPEPPPTDTLAEAIAAAYAGNPAIQVSRYELRADDDRLGEALAGLRPTTALEVTSGYDKIVPGRTTTADATAVELRRSSIITRNNLGVQLVLDQPLYSGGRVGANMAAADADIAAGRQRLRVAEGDLLLRVIGAYVDVQRDTGSRGIRAKNVAALEATLAEITARRAAGELTRTDTAQAQTQLQSARVQLALAEDQLEQSRAAYAALVGANPGTLAEVPALPLLPESIDAAFDAAETINPDLAAAIATELGSRARIAAARAEGRPSLALRSTAGLSGQAAPFALRNDDQAFGVRATLTIPLTNGGRVGARVAQADDRDSADRLRIDAARRQMVQDIIVAWNRVVTAQRNQAIQREQLKAAGVFYEGTFQEYRAGLRSTFDVLYAQNAYRETQIALLASERDRYFAQAAVLRHVGLLEARNLVGGIGLHDPVPHARAAARIGATPFDPVPRALDRIGPAGDRQQPLRQPPAGAPRFRPGPEAAAAPALVTKSPTASSPTPQPEAPR